MSRKTILNNVEQGLGRLPEPLTVQQAEELFSLVGPVDMSGQQTESMLAAVRNRDEAHCQDLDETNNVLTVYTTRLSELSSASVQKVGEMEAAKFFGEFRSECDLSSGSINISIHKRVVKVVEVDEHTNLTQEQLRVIAERLYQSSPLSTSFAFGQLRFECKDSSDPLVKTNSGRGWKPRDVA